MSNKPAEPREFNERLHGHQMWLDIVAEDDALWANVFLEPVEYPTRHMVDISAFTELQKERDADRIVDLNRATKELQELKSESDNKTVILHDMINTKHEDSKTISRRTRE